MKFRLLAAVAVAAFAAPLAAKPVEYRVLTQSRDIGHFKVDREGTAVSIDCSVAPKASRAAPSAREACVTCRSSKAGGSDASA